MQIKIRYLVIGVIIAFILGCLYAAVLRGREIRDYREREAEYQKRIRDYQAGEAEFNRRLAEYAVELERSRREIADTRAESQKLRRELAELRGPIDRADAGVTGAIDHAAGIGEAVDRIEAILRGVEERGPIPD